MFGIMFWIILDLVLLSLVILLGLEYFLNFLNKKCNSFKNFILQRDGFLGVSFLLLFSVEQLFFLLFFYKFSNNILFLHFGVSIFALIVITTASIQKIILEIKNRSYREKMSNVFAKTEMFLRYRKKKLHK